MPYLLEFLIPAYKRTDGVVIAALSIAQQIVANGYQIIVGITIVDDATPGFSRERLITQLGDMASLVSIESNEINKGMSQNIFDMVSNSKANFCTVLTDDDWLIDGKLVEIVEYLKSIIDYERIAGLFTPRYSYIETGELHCVVCRPFSQDRLIEAGPAPAMKYCHNGFILTGFIFRPEYFARQEWAANIENGFFPVINFGFILSRYSLLFVDRNWFHHTVLNVCHWESWGEDQLSRRRRLYRDYMDAISLLADRFICVDTPILIKSLIIWDESVNYLGQLRSNRIIPLSKRVTDVPQRTRLRCAFKCSVVIYPIYIPLNVAWRGILACLRILRHLVFAKKSWLEG